MVERMSRRLPDDVIDTEGGPATVTWLRERCSVLETGVVLIREAPHSNAEIFEVLLERARELGEPFGRFAIVNDLSEAKTRPRRQHLDAMVRALNGVGVHWAIVQPGSLFMRTVLRFVLARVSRHRDRASVHESMAAAVTAARAALAKPGG
jgi:hypothetical protein